MLLTVDGPSTRPHNQSPTARQPTTADSDAILTSSSTILATGDKSFAKRFRGSSQLDSVITITPLNVVDDICGAATAHNAQRVVIDLDYAGRSREGIEVAKALHGSGRQVVVLIRSGTKLSPEVVEDLRKHEAEIWWDSKALLTFKIEQFIEQRRDEGIKTLADVARAIGIPASTLSAHRNRSFGMQSLTNATFEKLGITEAERARCFNLKVLGLSVDERNKLKPEAESAIDLLLESNGGKYPGDTAAVKLIYDGLPKPKPFSRDEIYSVVCEVREGRGLSDPTAALVKELYGVDRKLREFRDPELERKMRDQQVGHLLEELALLELQLSRSRQVTQLCATVVRDSTGDIVRTTNILDVVKLDPQAMPILGKAICEMAVRRGLLEKLDEGRIEIAAPGSYELVYRPDQGGSVPFLHVDEDVSPTEGALSLRSRELLQMTALCMNGALAARYKDPSTGEILLPILPDRKAILVGEAGLDTEDLEQVLGKRFFSHLADSWKQGYPFRVCEYKKGGVQSESALSAIKTQLREQRDAILRARQEKPDSVLGMTGGIDVVVLRHNPGIHRIVDELNTEQPFFTYDVFSATLAKDIVQPLQQGKCSLGEVEALTSFFSRLNAELSQHPTLPIPELIFDSALQAVKRTARLEGPNQQCTLEELRESPGCFLAWNIDMINLAARQAEKLSADDPNISASDIQRFMSKALETMQLVLSESMLVAQEAGTKGYLRDPLRESSEEYVALRQGVDRALQSFHRYAIGAASIDNTELEAILATSLSGKQTRGGYNSSLIAREEGEGRFVTMRRVFAGESSQVGVVFHDAEKLITSHPSAAEAADAKVEDPESLERFLKLLKLELAEKEAFAAREEGLETKFAFKLLSFKLGTPTVQSEERFAERISYLSPLTGGLLEELKNHSQGRTGAEQPDEAEVALYHMLLQGGQHIRAAVLGESAQAVEAALREAESRNYNSRGLLEASKDESQSVGRSISAQLPSYRRALHDLTFSILQECRPDLPPRQGQYSDWRRECADIAAAHEDIVQFSLNRSLAQTADFNPLRRSTGVASGFEKVIASMEKHPLLVQISQELGPQLQGEGGEGVDEATAQQRLQEFFKRKMSDPVAQHELQAVSRDFVRSISQTLNESRRVELSGRLLTIIGGVEERVAHEFLTRALDRAILLETIHRDLAADYLSSSLATFLHLPGAYSDHYIDRFSAVHSELRRRLEDDVAFDKSLETYLSATSQAQDTTPEHERGRLLIALVRANLREHHYFAEARHPLSHGSIQILDAIRHGNLGEASALVNNEMEVDSFRPLRRIMATESGNVHLRLHRRAEVLGCDTDAEPSFMNSQFGSLSEKLLSSMSEASRQFRRLHSEIRTAHILFFEHWLRGSTERDTSTVKEAGKLFLKISAAHAERLGLTPLMAQDPRCYRGFRDLGPLERSLETLDRYAPGWRMLHLHATDYFARFCGYQPKVLA